MKGGGTLKSCTRQQAYTSTEPADRDMWSPSYNQTTTRGGPGCRGCCGNHWVAPGGQRAVRDGRHVNKGSEEHRGVSGQSTCDLSRDEGGANQLSTYKKEEMSLNCTM